jgi:hypothetical protein
VDQNVVSLTVLHDPWHIFFEVFIDDEDGPLPSHEGTSGVILNLEGASVVLVKEIFTFRSLGEVEVLKEMLTYPIGTLLVLLMGLPVDEMDVPGVDLGRFWEVADLRVNLRVVSWVCSAKGH